ncbi:MAG TPA: hypothetical protein IAA62_03175 [Candidatus Caccopulliclostridium gallistercoris]|uniref:MPN domain-containing protein n=1 Tax=Candidatus Caccopulliclostridium gallistercoris TaxID=2840719 RepID=A0A9D1NET0_9FIRM|nr:hypothetical protein [Candidatus Caccopulliclostridium gallistercoris]
MEENIHSDHRKRLTELIYKSGIENVSEVQALEFILFFGLPRGDTNPLAHRLLKKFKTISNVLNASLEDLTSVLGMGEQCAMRIKTLPSIFELYYKSGAEKDFSDLPALRKFILELLNKKKTEEFFVFGIDSRLKLLGSRKLASGSVDSVSIPRFELLSFINSLKPNFLAFAHNHTNGDVLPSKTDIVSTTELKKICDALGVKFLDHYIISDNKIFSMNEGKTYELK